MASVKLKDDDGINQDTFEIPYKSKSTGPNKNCRLAFQPEIPLF